MERAIKDAGLKRLAKQYGPKRAGHGDELRVLNEALGIVEESALPPHAALEEADKYLNENDVMSFGVEVLPYESGGPLRDQEVLYLNAGDTYVPTLMYTDAEGFFISSWGDWLEEAERQHEESEEERRCPYCGEWSGELEEYGECPYCQSDIYGQRPHERKGGRSLDRVAQEDAPVMDEDRVDALMHGGVPGVLDWTELLSYISRFINRNAHTANLTAPEALFYAQNLLDYSVHYMLNDWDALELIVEGLEGAEDAVGRNR